MVSYMQPCKHNGFRLWCYPSPPSVFYICMLVAVVAIVNLHCFLCTLGCIHTRSW